MHRLIIAFYDNFGSAHEAAKELIEKGFHQNSISVIVHQSVCERIWSGDRSKSWFFLSQPSAIQLPAVGPVLVSGFVASDPNLFDETGKKSLFRVLLKNLVPEPEAHAYTEGVRRRGILVVVRAESTTSSKALFILDRYCPVDIQQLAEQWREAGWTHFDDTARPLINQGLNWPNCITFMPGDGLLNDGVLTDWPRSIVGHSRRR